eukprot:NODE_6504_length_500_cov_228.557303.p5 GENE.NODE_6504_length_500_cov_228.557303~~NODE_6504_length_500_cov_228.557303.p5  ORF type:complete len:57 (-),score=3.74 NODE_6504_length_500_cov_228.557303:310-480(-)
MVGRFGVRARTPNLPTMERALMHGTATSSSAESQHQWLQTLHESTTLPNCNSLFLV